MLITEHKSLRLWLTYSNTSYAYLKRFFPLFMIFKKSLLSIEILKS